MPLGLPTVPHVLLPHVQTFRNDSNNWLAEICICRDQLPRFASARVHMLASAQHTTSSA